MSKTLFRVVGAWYDRMVASDPGYSRFRFAARATITVGLTLVLLLLLSHVTGHSFLAFVIGVVVSMISSVAVNDPDPSQQRLTAALIPLPAAVALTAGSLLSSSVHVGEAVFVLVMFTAVYVRRFGMRWFAFGMVGFISYFLAMFLRARPAELPWMYLAVFVGAGCAYLMRTFVMPDPVVLSIERMVPALRARIRRILVDVRALVTHHTGQERRYRRLRRDVVKLNELALVITDHPQADEWDDSLFRVELAVQQLTEQARHNPPAENREAVISDIAALEQLLRTRRLGAVTAVSWRTTEDERFGALLRQVERAIAQGGKSANERGSNARQLESEDGQKEDDDRSEMENEEADESGTAEEDSAPTLRPSTRQAIQVAAASVVAILGGELISTQRWYWAAITAFVVFTGTSSRGEVFVKGWQRVAGTLLGVLAGLLIGTAVGGNRIVSVVLIFTSIFVAFYVVRISYALMIFWITIMIAMLYGLLGFFSVQILAVRLEETVMGAVAGAIVALFLLPTSTQQVMRERSSELLKNLQSVIEACRLRLISEQDGERVLPAVRELDRTFQSLRQIAAPLIIRVPSLSEPRSSQHWLRVIFALRYEAHHLARLAGKKQWAEEPLRSEWNVVAIHLQERIGVLADMVEGDTPGETAMKDAQHADFEDTEEPSRSATTAVEQTLRRIDWIVTILAIDMGIAGKPVMKKNEGTLPRR